NGGAEVAQSRLTLAGEHEQLVAQAREVAAGGGTDGHQLDHPRRALAYALDRRRRGACERRVRPAPRDADEQRKQQKRDDGEDQRRDPVREERERDRERERSG